MARSIILLPQTSTLSRTTRLWSCRYVLSNTRTIHQSSHHLLLCTRHKSISEQEKLNAPTSSTETSTGSGKDNGAGPKAIIKNVDMSEELQQEAVDITSAALEKYNIEKDIAAQIKKEFDKRHGPTWHVVVGKNFGSYVTHGEYLFSPRVLPTYLSDFSLSRDEALYLLLRWLSCHPHLEIIDSVSHFWVTSAWLFCFPTIYSVSLLLRVLAEGYMLIIKCFLILIIDDRGKRVPYSVKFLQAPKK